RQTAVTAARGDLERFTITIAEALNGLRASAPPAPTMPGTQGSTNGVEPENTQPEGLAGGSARQHAFVAESSMLIDAEQSQPILALGARAELPLGASFDLLLDSLVTVAPLGLSEGRSELSAYLAWTRLGVRRELLREP